MSPPSATALEDTFLFHHLATDPDRVLPPGKSLLSLLSGPPVSQSTTTNNGLQAQVGRIAHQAFWDEAKETLSSPLPSVQMARLQLLYGDMLSSLKPLFPAQHRILAELTAPFPPTPSPLHSALAFLKLILKTLQERCAPIRDAEIDHVLQPLQSVPPVSTLSDHNSPDPSLASLVVGTIKAIVSLSQAMKEDLSNALLAGMSDSQLLDFVKQQARLKEREIIINWDSWNSNAGDLLQSDRQQVLRAQWHQWLSGDTSTQQGPEERHDWLSRLTSALFLSFPVSCMPEDTNANALPPQFFFLRPTLFYIQNHLQALVILGSLLTLLKSIGQATLTVVPDFTIRVWSLLELELDQDARLRLTRDDNSEESETKLINLSDEIIRARRLTSGATSESEERTIRAGVERTLRLEDPVFKLLQKRLHSSLEKQIVFMGGRRNDTGERRKGSAAHGIPRVMRTGRNHLNDALPSAPSRSYLSSQYIAIKGYEDDLLQRKMLEVIERIVACIDWLRYTWSDTVPM